MRRAAALAAVSLVIAGATARAAASAARGPRTDVLLPNVITLQPTGFVVTAAHGERFLRLSNTTANVGAGPLELQPRKRDCDGDGNPANDRTAIQHIYHDVNGDGVFERHVDTTFDARVAGSFGFDVSHGHWHLHDFASYELLDLTSGATIAANEKVGFCLSDSVFPYPGIPGAVRERRYRGCACNSVQGESIGHGDIYQWYLPGQWIDVTGVPDGEYCLVTTADPGGQLVESSDADNSFRQRIRLAGDGVFPEVDPC
jgi:hypothetical protein